MSEFALGLGGQLNWVMLVVGWTPVNDTVRSVGRNIGTGCQSGGIGWPGWDGTSSTNTSVLGEASPIRRLQCLI